MTKYNKIIQKKGKIKGIDETKLENTAKSWSYYMVPWGIISIISIKIIFKKSIHIYLYSSKDTKNWILYKYVQISISGQ